MPRVVIPEYGVLRLAVLPSPTKEQIEASPVTAGGGGGTAAGAVGLAAAMLGPLSTAGGSTSTNRSAIFSLRWALNPVIGFPRAPFRVWRRERKEEPTTPVAGTQVRNAPATVSLSTHVIEIRFHADPQGGSLLVEALGVNGNVLPGQRLGFTSAGDGRLRYPGISALRLTGNGQISSIGAIDQNDYANRPDWQLFDLVGFPYLKGEISTPDYDPVSQGRANPSAQLDGVDAALFRLQVARLMQQPPPAPGGGLAQPVWNFPDPKLFLDLLRKGPLVDVTMCLQNSDDGDPTRLQILQMSGGTFDGISQPGVSQPDPNKPATITLPTTKYIGIAVTDSPVAVGMGFGTYDVAMAHPWPLKDTVPPDVGIASWDYMITAKITLAFGYRIELAAIGFLEAAPDALQNLQTTQTFANRPITRDQVGSAAVMLDWAPARRPIGAGILTHRASTDAIVNVPRPQSAGGFQPYLMPYMIAPNGEPDMSVRPGVTMPEEPAPTSGTSTTTYAVGPIDVHGRWGPWTLTNHTLAADPVQKPGLAAVSISYPDSLPGAGPVVSNATLAVEVTWDWADRSPDRIELVGGFCPLGPPPVSVSGFQTSNTGGVGSFVVTIGFSTSGVPAIRVPSTPLAAVTVAQAATVVEISDPNSPSGSGAPQVSSAGSQVRRYRLTVPIMQLSFALSGQLAYAVSADAAEAVRPTELSALVDPRATTMSNPFPAPPPAIPAVEVLWTAQPDASGRARTVLSWPAVAGASGYIVWEATEAALFEAVSGSAPPVGQPIRARAIDLKSRVTSNQVKSLASFTRLNERPITETSMELALSGSADTLYAYRLSSITEQNVESDRSGDIVLVGVPRIERPGTPSLEGEYDAARSGVVLTIVAGSGLVPAALEVHRVRKSLLAQTVDTMGPAVPALSSPLSALTAVPVVSLSGSTRTGYQFVDASVTASWFPYFYRAIARGRDLPSDGIRSGTSAASPVAVVLLPPALPPQLTALTVTRSGTATLIAFSTDLPTKPTPVGNGRLEISAIGNDGVRTVLATFDPTAVRPAAALTMPGTTLTTPDATRRAPVNGMTDVTVLVPPTPDSIAVTGTDPLYRSIAVEGS